MSVRFIRFLVSAPSEIGDRIVLVRDDEILKQRERRKERQVGCKREYEIYVTSRLSFLINNNFIIIIYFASQKLQALGIDPRVYIYKGNLRTLYKTLKEKYGNHRRVRFSGKGAGGRKIAGR